MPSFVSRGGIKLEFALNEFDLDVAGKTCADLGSNVGGFVDCLLKRGAAKVYAIDTGYGVLAWKLRHDPRVVVMERTNAMHVNLPEPVQIVTIDAAWTRQKHILPAARMMLDKNGMAVALIKPHYEAEATRLRRGKLPADLVDGVVAKVLEDVKAAGFRCVKTVDSPITGAGGNREVLALLESNESLKPV